MDEWIHIHSSKTHDANGEWAASGKVHASLLTAMLADPYFALSPPKSTGREYFNQAWLQYHLVKVDSVIPAEDVQATLAELTAVTIMDAIKDKMPHGEVMFAAAARITVTYWRNYKHMQAHI